MLLGEHPISGTVIAFFSKDVCIATETATKNTL